jgi:hypothetical protein
MGKFDKIQYSRGIKESGVLPLLDSQVVQKSDQLKKVANVTDKWLSFVWYQGGGLPIQPPLKLDDKRHMYIPPFLFETVISVKDDEITYGIDNSWIMRAHSQFGRVQFIETEEGIEMIWKGEVHPMRGWSWFVQTFFSAVISTM